MKMFRAAFLFVPLARAKTPSGIAVLLARGRKASLNFLAIVLIAGMNSIGLFAIGETLCHFNDTEISSENILTAGTLDFELYSIADFTPEITSTQNSARTIAVIDATSTMDYNYKVKVENASGELCEDLLLDDGNGPQALNTFISAEILYSDKQEWTFDASIVVGSSDWEGETCQFDFVFEGWQDNILFGTGGFSDVETISNIISNSDQPPVLSSCMKINEVYYDPDAEHQGEPNEMKFEWIELYNACEDEVNLQNWYLEDNQGESYREVIHSTYPIESGQFVVIAASAAVWNTYWTLIPDNAEKIALGGEYMFNGLANKNDRVVLYDNYNNEIDCVGWGDDNYCGFSDGPVGDVAEGHSISRKEKGVDNNSADDWFDTHSGSTPPGPNPGTNPHSEDGTLLLSPATSLLFVEGESDEDDGGDVEATNPPATDEQEEGTTEETDLPVTDGQATDPPATDGQEEPPVDGEEETASEEDETTTEEPLVEEEATDGEVVGEDEDDAEETEEENSGETETAGGVTDPPAMEGQEETVDEEVAGGAEAEEEDGTAEEETPTEEEPPAVEEVPVEEPAEEVKEETSVEEPVEGPVEEDPPADGEDTPDTLNEE